MTDPDQIEQARKRMLADQLRARGIRSDRVLEAMGRVPREHFVPTEFQAEAYADGALPIDCGQTISQPYIVALMTEALETSGDERVLEIGTGSGYQTAVLAELAREVVSIERHAKLSAQAATAVGALGYDNVIFEVGDGSLGWPQRAPYDRILVAAAAIECPPALLEQLAEGGILVIPLGDADTQILRQLRKAAGKIQQHDLSPCRFVPLIGAQGWPGS